MDQQNQPRRQKREYIRVPGHLRDKLLKLVLLKGKQIKQAALILKIKYPTAKTIVYYHKQSIFRKVIHKEATRVCQYVVRSTPNPIEVIVKVGGNIVQ